jgi:hypothetical protein
MQNWTSPLNYTSQFATCYFVTEVYTFWKKYISGDQSNDNFKSAGKTRDLLRAAVGIGGLAACITSMCCVSVLSRDLYDKVYAFYRI